MSQIYELKVLLEIIKKRNYTLINDSQKDDSFANTRGLEKF